MTATVESQRLHRLPEKGAVSDAGIVTKTERSPEVGPIFHSITDFDGGSTVWPFS
jgi:hypothetical protein